MYYIYSLCCILVPNMLWQFGNRKKLTGPYKLRHMVWTYIFMFYLFLAVQKAAGIGTIWDLIRYRKPDATINLVPFQSEGAMTYILNVFMFMPLGFLLPLIWKDYRKCIRTVLVGFLFSCTIEFCQLFCFRVTDIDDLTMNTLGALAGYIMWLVFHRMFPNSGEKAAAYKKTEPLWYIWLGVAGIFFLYNWSWLP